MCFPIASSSTCTQQIWTVLPYTTVAKLLSLFGSSLSITSGFQFPKPMRLTCMCLLSSSLFLWVFLPFPPGLEPISQLQLQLTEDQESQRCSGSCQPQEREWLQATTAKGTPAAAGRRGSRRIFRSA